MAARIVVVGCGGIAAHHARAMRGLPLSITAAVDIDTSARQRFGSSVGCTSFPSLDDVPDDLADTVLLLLPHYLHEEFAVSVLRSGRNLVLEKPLAPTIASCTKILEAAKDATGTFLVAENSGYWPEVVATLNLIKDGCIGDVISASSHYCEAVASPALGDSVESYLQWRQSKAKAGGGVMMDGGLHWLRPLRLFLDDDVVSVTGTLGNGGIAVMEGESVAHALLRTSSGLTGLMQATVVDSGTLSSQAPWFVVTGTTGQITVDPSFDGGMALWNAAHPNGFRRVIPAGSPRGYYSSFTGMWADFARVLINGCRPQFGVEFAFQDVGLVRALYDAAQAEAWVPVNAPSHKISC